MKMFKLIVTRFEGVYIIVSECKNMYVRGITL